MGFCLFNNVAVGARVATAEFELDRVLIVDWDVHHGNGTQNAFWEDGQVGFLSIHRWPFYPGTGRADETGSGRGLRWIANLPVEMGTSRADYLKQFTSGAGRAGPTRQAAIGDRQRRLRQPIATIRSARSAWKPKISSR